MATASWQIQAFGEPPVIFERGDGKCMMMMMMMMMMMHAQEIPDNTVFTTTTYLHLFLAVI